MHFRHIISWCWLFILSWKIVCLSIFKALQLHGIIGNVCKVPTLLLQSRNILKFTHWDMVYIQRWSYILRIFFEIFINFFTTFLIQIAISVLTLLGMKVNRPPEVNLNVFLKRMPSTWDWLNLSTVYQKQFFIFHFS